MAPCKISLAYRRPFAFIAEAPAYGELRAGYREDMGFAQDLRPALAEDWGGRLSFRRQSQPPRDGGRHAVVRTDYSRGYDRIILSI